MLSFPGLLAPPFPVAHPVDKAIWDERGDHRPRALPAGDGGQLPVRPARPGPGGSRRAGREPLGVCLRGAQPVRGALGGCLRPPLGCCSHCQEALWGGLAWGPTWGRTSGSSAFRVGTGLPPWFRASSRRGSAPPSGSMGLPGVPVCPRGPGTPKGLWWTPPDNTSVLGRARGVSLAIGVHFCIKRSEGLFVGVTEGPPVSCTRLRGGRRGCGLDPSPGRRVSFS